MAILSPLPVCRTSRKVAVNSALEESTRVHPGPVRIVSPFFFFVATGANIVASQTWVCQRHKNAGSSLKSTGIAPESGLWETEDMASQKSYAPKAGDTVLVKDHSGRFVITQVDTTAQNRRREGDFGGHCRGHCIRQGCALGVSFLSRRQSERCPYRERSDRRSLSSRVFFDRFGWSNSYLTKLRFISTDVLAKCGAVGTN